MGTSVANVHVNSTQDAGAHEDLKTSRAVQLIETLLHDGVLSEETLAQQLVVRPRTLASYRDGTTPMPLARQLCLALFMTQLEAKYARMGYALRDQVRAAGSFEVRMNGGELSAR
jgi:hypothetical protein